MGLDVRSRAGYNASDGILNVTYRNNKKKRILLFHLYEAILKVAEYTP